MFCPEPVKGAGVGREGGRRFSDKDREGFVKMMRGKSAADWLNHRLIQQAQQTTAQAWRRRSIRSTFKGARFIVAEAS